jgi:Tfp pilus assembly protein PilF
VTIALLALIGFQIIHTIEPRLAKRYFDRGVTYLQSQNYTAAAQEFQKAENAGDATAHGWYVRTEAAVTDPKVFQDEWRQWNVTSVMHKLDNASEPFTDPKAALARGIELYQANEAPYAQYAIDRALELDPRYPEAWHYRYLTYQVLARDSSLYRDKAEVARKTRDALTSLYLNP